MHQKINVIPKSWPIERKNRTFVVRSVHFQIQGIPLLVAMRDILHAVANRKELKMLIRDNKIKVNGKVVKDDKFPLVLMSVLSFGDKNYKVLMNDKRKFSFKEIHGNDAKEITLKVIGKKILKKGNVQFNLFGGYNFIGGKDIDIGDSVVLDLEKNDVKKTLKLEKGSHVMVIGGRHTGKTGMIKHLEKNLAKIVEKDIHIDVNLNNIMAVEK